MSEKDQREAILKTALPLFLRYGFRKTSMEDVAKAAGLSKATVYHYFESKEHVFAAIVRARSMTMIDAVHQAVSEASSHADKVRAFFLVRLRSLRQMGELSHASADVLEEMAPMAQRMCKDFIEAEGKYLEELFVAGVKAGDFEIGDTKLLAMVMMFALKGVGSSCVSSDAGEQLFRGVEQWVEVIVRGISSAKQLEISKG